MSGLRQDSILLTASRQTSIDYREVKRCLGNTRLVPDIKERIKELSKAFEEPEMASPAPAAHEADSLNLNVPVKDQVITIERRARRTTAAAKAAQESSRSSMTPSRKAALRARKVTDGAFTDDALRRIDQKMTPSRKEALRAKRVTGSKASLSKIEAALGFVGENKISRKKDPAPLASAVAPAAAASAAEEAKDTLVKSMAKSFAPKTPSRLRNLLESSANVTVSSNDGKGLLWKVTEKVATPAQLKFTDSGFDDKEVLAAVQEDNTGDAGKTDIAVAPLPRHGKENSFNFIKTDVKSFQFKGKETFAESPNRRFLASQRRQAKDDNEDTDVDGTPAKITFAEDAPTPPRATQIIGKRRRVRDEGMDESPKQTGEGSPEVVRGGIRKRLRLVDDARESSTAQRLVSVSRGEAGNWKKLKTTQTPRRVRPGTSGFRTPRMVATPRRVPATGSGVAMTAIDKNPFRPASGEPKFVFGQLGWLAAAVRSIGNRLGL
ncbi:hypothetical protein HDU67_009017 [Dinochytrium kinnereticum]|nr:hypothetical protein HDU67_009017 [Dinochytrium kinnereticum]